MIRSLTRRMILLQGSAMLAGGCLSLNTISVPMRSIAEPLVVGQTASSLLVLMPGVYDRPEDFIEQGFVREVRARRIEADIVAVDSHLGYINAGIMAERVHDDIIAPARARGVRSVWLAGISLGALAAMLYTSQRGQIDGIIALAPYLGTREALAEIRAAGGWHGWDVASSTALLPWEVSLHAWIKSWLAGGATQPEMLLAYGEQDRFAPAQLALGEQMPAQRVFTRPGGHDWPTWIALWRTVLDASAPRIGARQIADG